jgi:tRNA pseudouridine38-40 synthase
MFRYFLQVSYNGSAYSGFQIQQNANTVQAESERALEIFFRKKFFLTGSSRTDAGVHAHVNFFHFDVDEHYPKEQLERIIYHLNAILPGDIVFKKIFQVPKEFHARFDALYRTYHYHIYREKDPFVAHSAYYYPYILDQALLQSAANLILGHHDFSSFAKRNNQVKFFDCMIYESYWDFTDDVWFYKVRGNRFLRGMVRGLVGTMLLVGRGKITLDEFEKIILSKDQSMVDFSAPAHGLFLKDVGFPDFSS